ncbi:MAG: SHOCT domain-containing protein [Nitriliruptoraceae bacterium]
MSILQWFLLMLYFTFFVIWIWLLISVYADVFRSKDLSGVRKAGWVFLLLVLPYIGVLIYLIARGGSMQERSLERAQAAEQATQAYIREAAGAPSPAEELTKLAELRDKGVLSPEEFDAQKARLLA